MPSGGQTTDEMLILKWNKQVGDIINKGDILFEIETDKAVLEVESFAEGKLLEISYPAGLTVKVGAVVALIGEEADVKKSVNPDDNKSMGISASVTNKTQPTELIIEQTVEVAKGKRILASPLAKSLAKIENIRLEDVAMTVSNSIIKKADIYQYLKNEKDTKTHEILNATDEYNLLEVSSIRKTIARRMKESLSVAPHYVISVDVDMTATVALRNKLNANKQVVPAKISFNDIIMKVVAKAIERFPIINSTYNENQICVFKEVNIGLAVALEMGIIVPVVRSVNKKSILEISIANTKNIDKVKNNQISETDLKGGTITISNLGMFGIDYFTAIINQPESCILAVGSISKKPVVFGNEIVIRDIMNITGSFDHRVIDGAIGAQFLQKIREVLENPVLLLY
jgi:pyruvate dehydrogenase E2 component (dihydrolipoamide acetyltransferase)